MATKAERLVARYRDAYRNGRFEEADKIESEGEFFGEEGDLFAWIGPDENMLWCDKTLCPKEAVRMAAWINDMFSEEVSGE